MQSVQGMTVNQQRLDDAVLVARRLAHAYSNVLTSVLGFVELGIGQAPANSTLRRYLDVALRGAQQGATLSQRLRLLGSRTTLTAGGVSLLSALARQAGRRAVPGQPVEESMYVPGDLPLLSLGNEQLSAVLDALLDNAHEAVDGKGRVSISAAVVSLGAEHASGLIGLPTAGVHVRLDVSDSGPGLSPEARERLFREPFWTSKARHHGLGLTIVYSILTGQQGAFCLLDTPGGGLTVRVFLPAAGRETTAQERGEQS